MGFLTLAITSISTTSTTSTTASSTFATLYNHNRQASSDKGQAGRTSQLWTESLSDCIYPGILLVMGESIYSHVNFIIRRLLNVSPIHLMKKYCNSTLSTKLTVQDKKSVRYMIGNSLFLDVVNLGASLLLIY